MELSHRGSQRVLLSSFLAIVLLIVLTRLVALHVVHHSLDRNRASAKSLVTSIELVSRMDHDVSRRRLLTDAHVFETEAVGMARVEAEMGAVQGDYADAARAYEAIPKRPDTEQAWRSFSAKVAAMAQPMESALALSRQNRDSEAGAAMSALQAQFAEIDRDAGSLIEAAHRDAAMDMADIRKRENAGLAASTTLAMLAAAATGVLGIWVSRLVRRRERLLEEKNRELDAFAGRVAHDLRGPLTSIGLAATRLSRVGGDETTSGLFARSVRRMETLIADLLALSQVGAQPGGECDPAQVVAQIGEELTPRVRAEQGTLQTDVEHAHVRCAEGLLRQVLWNLTENAFKYRRPDAHPEIEVSGQSSQGTYRLRVSDNGQGMTPEDTRHALEPFYRSPRDHGTPGTGLGLSIVKRIIEANQGTVRIEARSGSGTTVTVELPLTRSEAAA